MSTENSSKENKTKALSQIAVSSSTLPKGFKVYTNGVILVPLFRVLDAIAQKGEQYQESC